jgi:hypothetical protein
MAEIIKSTDQLASVSLSALPFSIPCHFLMHPRQRVAVACGAMKTGIVVLTSGMLLKKRKTDKS